MLQRALGFETETAETLDEVLNEIDVRDADWRIGNYQILEEIGRGGMGVIYRARQRHSLRIVALKRILSYQAESQQTLARFRREAEAAASLDHPNILPIYEVSESEDGLPFFSMKFAAGGSLLDAAPGLRGDSLRIVALIAKVTRAVQYAHSHGILHRDLKPGNILLDGRGEPLVSDFGLAKWLDTSSDLTRTLTIFGTPGYIAPEQAQGPAKNVTPAADIYSIGAVLFDLFTGKTPFVGEHALAVIKQASDKPAPKLRTLSPSADRDLETICAKCLEREPQARYGSAGDLAEDLERRLEGRPIIARPVLPPVRIWRWSKRNPKLAASLTTAVVLGMLLVAVALPFGWSFFSTQPPPAIPEKSIAVLPFENLGDEKQNAFLADGVQDEILNDLAKVSDLKVISRTSVMQYKSGVTRNLRELAKELGVAHVLEGSVQHAGDRVRVSAQLIDARSDTHLWGDHFDRDLADVFAIESEIAEKIVAELKSKLSPQEKSAIEERPTADLTAYDFYLRATTIIGTAALNVREKEKFLEAERLLKQAVERDPGFFLAYYRLARTHDRLYILGIDHTQRRLDLADAAIRNAMRLRPDAGEGHLALAAHLYSGYRDYVRAREELDVAARLLPNEPLVFELTGYIDRRQGRWEDCISNLKRALALDPRNSNLLVQIALAYQNLRRFSEMVGALDRALMLVPKDPGIRVQRGLVELEWRANPKPLHSVIQEIIAEDPNAAGGIAGNWLYLALCERDHAAATHAIAAMTDDGCRNEGIPLPRAWCEGVAARARGDVKAADAAFTSARVEAEKTLIQQPGYPEASCVLGMIDAALGHKEEAIRLGRHSVELLPVTKDAINGALLVEYLALIYAWTGDRDQALEQLAMAAKIPSDVSYGQLRLHPYWDPLRGDPRFEKIVASLAPK
jgi:serine/threonine protein kinase/tetratricopeptide (TPR) repeat protein